MAITTSTSAASKACDAYVDLIDTGGTSGTLQILSSGLTVLASTTFSNPAFGNASNGVATANAIGTITSATNTGTASWFRVNNSAGVAIFSGTVSASGGDMNLNTTSIAMGDQITITSFVATVPTT